MKIRMVFNFGPEERRVLGRELYGLRTLSREELINWIQMTVNATFESIRSDYDRKLLERSQRGKERSK